MRDALVAIAQDAEDDCAATTGESLRQLRDAIATDPRLETGPIRQALLGTIKLKVKEGHLRVIGLHPGEKQARPVELILLLQANADFDDHTLITKAGVISCVMVLSVEVAAQTASFARQPARLDYRETDKLLFPRMEQLIETGRAKSRQDAARLVYMDALGTGTPDSKVTRLMVGFGKWLNRAHD